MPTPQGIPTVNLFGKYLLPDALGTPLQGQLIFTPNVDLIYYESLDIIVGGKVTVNLVDGAFNVDLIATDTVGQDPTGWAWNVSEQISGIVSRTYPIFLPQGSGPLDITDISPAEAGPIVYLPVAGPEGPSAYDVAVSNGFVGTEAEWLTSLEGADGADGFVSETQYNDLLAADNAAVKLTGDQSVAGIKTFTSIPVGPAADPTLADQLSRKFYVDAGDAALDGRLDIAETDITNLETADGQNVKLTGDQAVAGIKTFSSIPVGPTADPTTDDQLSRKAYVDAGDGALDTRLDTAEGDILNLLLADSNSVKKTGDQNVDGIKTFGSIPVLPASDPSTDNQAARKAYVDRAALVSHTFSKTGALTVTGGVSRVYLDRTYNLVSVRAGVNTAPTGQSLIVDVNKNGTTIYTTQANRPTIAVSENTDAGGTADVTTFAAGDYLTVDIDQIGSTVAGSDLTVTVVLKAA